MRDCNLSTALTRKAILAQQPFIIYLFVAAQVNFDSKSHMHIS